MTPAKVSANLMKRELKVALRQHLLEGVRPESHEERIESSISMSLMPIFVAVPESHEERIERAGQSTS